ncbi:hypothetical protein MMC13_002814 [Lambiella insularis]|nr:hypothetical protein [Lambiella insularis]
MTSRLHIAILSFYERNATPKKAGKLLVVSEAAASIGLAQETRCGLEANHFEMTKFQNARSLGYVVFLRFLRVQIKREGIRSISLPISIIAFEEEIQQSTLQTLASEDDPSGKNTMLTTMGTYDNLLEIDTLSGKQS